MKTPPQIISKEWGQAIWELNRILAALQRDIDAKSVEGDNVNNVLKQVIEEADETLHWVL